MTTMEVTGINDTDSKTSKGWKKTYSVTMTGILNGVTLSLTARSQDRDALEEIVPFDKNAQRAITIGPVNHTLGSYPGAPGQEELDSEEVDEEEQDEQLRILRQQLHDAKDEENKTKAKKKTT